MSNSYRESDDETYNCDRTDSDLEYASDEESDSDTEATSPTALNQGPETSTTTEPRPAGSIEVAEERVWDILRINQWTDPDAAPEDHTSTCQPTSGEDVGPISARANFKDAITQLYDAMVQETADAGAQAAQDKLQNLSERLDTQEDRLESIEEIFQEDQKEASDQSKATQSLIGNILDDLKRCQDSTSSNSHQSHVFQREVNERFSRAEKSLTDRVAHLEKSYNDRLQRLEKGINDQMSRDRRSFNDRIARLEQDFNNRISHVSQNIHERKRKRT
ncbi:hypothetical protein NW762_009180 [Fusarium torreyae]|uniref:Uncharacterized protein n=1 Tax=Fusarium torreyae TaxID=1237075 RepID=A0A9W8RVN2_9HYPO|nr:hypothetical protein NW762_009180 [Fusarium torreyae]